MRFMGPLSDEDISVLQDHYLHSEKPATRRRAHAILLSNKQFSMDQITVILEVTRETVGHWFNSWEAQGIDGLHDKARSGRVPIYNESDIDQLETLLKESPHQLKTAQARLEKNTGKQSCGETLKRALKKRL